MPERSAAWLLVPGEGQQISVAQHEVVEYVDSPDIRQVPSAPQHCSSVLFWREQIVPLMDFRVLAGQDATAPIRAVVVLAYQTQARMPLAHVAIGVEQAPARIAVDDSQLCELPADNADLWEFLAMSCFSHEETPTLILNIAALCSAQFRDHVGRREI